MNLFFITRRLDPGRCGIGDYTRQMSDALVKRGHTGTCIALDLADADSMGPFFQKCRQNPPAAVFFQYEPYLYAAKGFPWRALLFLRRLRQIIDVPIILVMHGVAIDWTWRPTLWLLAFLQRLVALGLVIQVKAVIVVSSDHQAFLAPWCRWLKKKLFLLPIASNIPVAMVSPEEMVSLKNRMASSSAGIIGFFGLQRRAEEWDQLRALAQVFERKHIDVQFLVLGADKREEENASSLPPSIRFPGWMTESEISRHLQVMDVFLYLRRGPMVCSGSLLAAMSHGLPIVTWESRIGRQDPFFLRNNPGIVAIPFGDMEMMVDRLILLLRDVNLRHTLGEQSKGWYRKTTGWDRIAQGTTHILGEICS